MKRALLEALAYVLAAAAVAYLLLTTTGGL